MSTEIIKVLDALCEKFGIAVDWTAQNVMPYAQALCGKYITYEIAMSVVYMIIGLILLIVAYVSARAMYKHREWWMDDGQELLIVPCLVIIFLTVFGLSLIIGQIFDIITCFTFPEKMLFEELHRLMRTS